jgi:hypothetical protein
LCCLAVWRIESTSGRRPLSSSLLCRSVIPPMQVSHPSYAGQSSLLCRSVIPPMQVSHPSYAGQSSLLCRSVIPPMQVSHPSYAGQSSLLCKSVIPPIQVSHRLRSDIFSYPRFSSANILLKMPSSKAPSGQIGSA